MVRKGLVTNLSVWYDHLAAELLLARRARHVGNASSPHSTQQERAGQRFYSRYQTRVTVVCALVFKQRITKARFVLADVAVRRGNGNMSSRIAPQHCGTNSFLFVLFKERNTLSSSDQARLPISIPHLATIEEGANVDNFDRTRKAASNTKAYRKSRKDASATTHLLCQSCAKNVNCANTSTTAHLEHFSPLSAFPFRPFRGSVSQ